MHRLSRRPVYRQAPNNPTRSIQPDRAKCQPEVDGRQTAKRPLWTTKINFFPRGKKGERERISRAARQVATEAYTKFKVDCFTILDKGIRATEKALVKAMVKAMVKASFLTTEDQENLYNQAHNARAAEDTKNLEVLGAEDTKQRERESNQPCRPHPYTRGGYRGNRRGRRRGYDSQYEVPGRQKEKRKERERERERERPLGGHTFSQTRWIILLLKSCFNLNTLTQEKWQ